MLNVVIEVTIQSVEENVLSYPFPMPSTFFILHPNESQMPIRKIYLLYTCVSESYIYDDKKSRILFEPENFRDFSKKMQGI